MCNLCKGISPYINALYPMSFVVPFIVFFDTSKYEY